MYLLPPFRHKTSCMRCGLKYPKDEPNCTHCYGLSDTELSRYLETRNDGAEDIRDLGKLFIYIAILLAITTFLVALS